MRFTTALIRSVFCFVFLWATAGYGSVPPSDPELDSWIGQMIMVGFRGLTIGADDPITADIVQTKIGGVILFDYDVPTRTPIRNIESPRQTRLLVRQLQAKATVPLFIAIDQEGGRISRLKEKFGFPPTMSAQQLGAIDDLNTTRDCARKTALSLRELGINLNFAPVVDLNKNPENPVIGTLERSFSADPAVVTRHALAFVQEHRAQGVLCALKHFPGHGSSRADSHLGFVDVTGTWDDSELTPYRELIKAGQADVVMTAHIFNARLDPDYPGTLSRPVVTGLLREKLGFQGVVVSDDLQMKAISAHYGLETAIEKSVEAGVDVLVFANNSVFEPDIAARSVAILKTLVTEGEITRARIAESYGRIMRLKARLGSRPN
jgi:beta-N-acetylhexosaminidase